MWLLNIYLEINLLSVRLYLKIWKNKEIFLIRSTLHDLKIWKYKEIFLSVQRFRSTNDF
jgi:hypothetical protein